MVVVKFDKTNHSTPTKALENNEERTVSILLPGNVYCSAPNGLWKQIKCTQKLSRANLSSFKVWKESFLIFGILFVHHKDQLRRLACT